MLNSRRVAAYLNPSLHPTAYSELRPLPAAGELKRLGSSIEKGLSRSLSGMTQPQHTYGRSQ